MNSYLFLEYLRSQNLEEDFNGKSIFPFFLFFTYIKLIMAGHLVSKFDMIVHHLAMMKPECKIYYVKKVDRIYFVSDTLKQARKEKFVPCKYCNDEST